MNTKIQNIVIALTLGLLMVGCHTYKKSVFKQKATLSGKTSSSAAILPAPINSYDAKELEQPIYTDRSYFILQDSLDKFKDNAPFIEYLDGGKRERLWFSTSRADNVFFGHKKTNNYQQIYYCEREVGEGVLPNAGWGKITILRVACDDSTFMLKFNESTKGALAIANNTMIFSSDLISENGNSEFKNLWEVKREDEVFRNPKPILELSNENTWESQPTLSSNGKHLFFVSNRKIEPDGVTINNNETVNEMNIFYSFFEDGKWRKPVTVTELLSAKNEITPHIGFDNAKIYFSSNKDGHYQIYEAALQLDDENGGYTIDKANIKLFSNKTFDVVAGKAKEVIVNSAFDQNYPFIYFNKQNKKAPRAIYWSSNKPGGYGSFDVYGCFMPFDVTYNVSLADAYPSKEKKSVEYPVIKIEGNNNETVEKESTSFQLYSGFDYQLFGGSTANQEKGVYYCDADQKYIFVGYSKIIGNPADHVAQSQVINGAEVKSKLTELNGKLPLNAVFCDTMVYDTIFVTRAWQKKPPCPGKLNIEPTYRSVAYFQTGYWEVNTSENLKRDLEKLHEGFEFTNGGSIYNPTGRIKRNRSDYKVAGYEAPVFPVKTNDQLTLSIANAPWIELHPNNQYWGDRPGMENRNEQRMKGRKDRINQYQEYAKKVDENLKNLTDTIKNKYIYLLDLHKDVKPQLLIEIFAVSDQREVSRSWYIGDTVTFRESEYDEKLKRFITDSVKIIPPVVNEKTKTITQLKPCSVSFNKDGDNGSILGISSEKTDQNTNLSRLRSWYGYKEVLKRLSESNDFKRYLKEGKVALPDNNVSYEDAEIIIITRGIRKDGDIENPKFPYPIANNPTSNGYFDYDDIRHMEIQSRFLINKAKKEEDNFCCDPGK